MTTATLTDTLSTEQLALLRTRLETATPQEQRAIVASLAETARQRCAEDLLFFAQFVRTRDEADSSEGAKPFPVHKEYLRRLFDVFLTKNKIVVAKSRQVMASWAVCVFMVWTARFHPHRLVIYQTQNWDDSVKMTAMPGATKDGGFSGRSQFIELNLPSWLQQNVQFSEGRVIYPGGSMIESLPGGASKIRGKTPTLAVLDEFAYFEEARSTMVAVLPLAQKGAKIICMSTPQGAEGSCFYHIYSGLPFGHAA